MSLSRRLTLAAVLIAFAAAAVPVPAQATDWPVTPRAGSRAADTIKGTKRADYLRGLEGPDTISGGSGDDLLMGDTGGDLVRGGPGNDTITGAAGGDRLLGNAGDDVILGGFGADTIDGGDGDDSLDGANDTDIIRGGNGNDVIHGGSGPDYIDGGAGDDRLYADSGGDAINGGDGDDVIFVEAGSITRVDCGAGDDELFLVRSPESPDDSSTAGVLRRTVGCERTAFVDAALDPNQGIKYLAPDAGGAKLGSAKDDLLLGGPGSDQLTGGAGNDVLWGLRQAGLTSSAPDVLDAGAGDDTLYGGPGPQTIDGGPGDDFINGGLGDGTIRGGTGADTIRLRGSGQAQVDGGPGNDTIYVNGPAIGRVRCGAGTDTVYANRGDLVAKDCEKLVAAAGSQPGRLRTATSRADAANDPTGNYAALVRTTPGLVHWWRLGLDPKETNQLNPSVARDEISGVLATAYGAREPGVVDGDTDQAWVARNGMSPQVTDAPLRSAASTIETWVRSGPTPATREDVVNDQAFTSGADPFSSLRVSLLSNGRVQAAVVARDGMTLTLTSLTGAVPADTWHHLAFTRDGTTARLYVDGTEVASGADLATAGTQTSTGWTIGSYSYPLTGALDEFAIYDRALSADTVKAHARVGDDGAPPVTKLARPIPPTIPASYPILMSTAHAGTRYRCLIDAQFEISCPPDLTLRYPTAGPHTIRLRAIDRFGRQEAAPVTYSFIVDTTAPLTLAAVMLGLRGDERSFLALGSNDPAAHYECVVVRDKDTASAVAGFSACTPGMELPDNAVRVLARGVDVAGNPDPSPVNIALNLRTDPIFDTVFPAFGAARGRLEIGSVAGRTPDVPARCAIDGAPAAGCVDSFLLPVLAQGSHSLQVSETARGFADPITASLKWTVPPPAGVVQLAGVQFPAIVEGGSQLAKRVPRVRLVLSEAAKLALVITGSGGRQVTSFRAQGTTGANALKIPAAALRKLTLGRYSLVVVAQGSTGTPVAARLPFALIPRTR